MWTWKTEEASDWSMSTGITYGKLQAPIGIGGGVEIRLDTHAHHC